MQYNTIQHIAYSTQGYVFMCIVFMCFIVIVGVVVVIFFYSLYACIPHLLCLMSSFTVYLRISLEITQNPINNPITPLCLFIRFIVRVSTKVRQFSFWFFFVGSLAGVCVCMCVFVRESVVFTLNMSIWWNINCSLLKF